MDASERLIDNAVDELDPAAFQLLAEDVVRRALPGFEGLVRYGANARGETRKGWPDAYAVLDDGRWVGMEASRAGGWKAHLAGDIAHLQDASSPIAAFAAVLWASTPPPDEVMDVTTAMHEAGVPRGGIFLLFRQSFVALLARPSLADIRQSRLGLAASDLPFAAIDAAPIFGQNDLDTRLSVGEVGSGSSDLGGVADQTQELLESEGGVLVTGGAGTGKTTMAAGIGMRFWQRCLYLDFAAPRGIDGGQASAAMVARSDPQVLFVLDNAHLDIATANSLAGVWSQTRSSAALLVLSREMHERRGPGGVAYPGLDRLRPVDITPDRRVLLRLVQRVAAGYEVVSRSEIEQLDLLGLLNEHAGDLLVLTASLAYAASLGKPLSEATASDAQRFVRSQYLDQLNAEEVEALLAVATLASVELTVDESSVPFSQMRKAVELGIARVVETTRRERAFTTSHPQLGKLLIEAYGSVGPRSIDVLAAAAQAERTGGEVLPRLIDYGRREWAALVVSDPARREMVLTRLMQTGQVGDLPRQLSHLQRAGVISLREVDAGLVGSAGLLADRVLRAAPQVIVSLLDYLQRRLVKTHAEVCRLLSTRTRAESLRETIGSQPMDAALKLLPELDPHVPALTAQIRTAASSGDGLVESARWLLLGTTTNTLAHRVRLLRPHPELEGRLAAIWKTDTGRKIFAQAVSDGFDLESLKDAPDVGRRRLGRNEAMQREIRDAALDETGTGRLFALAASDPDVFWRLARLAIVANRRPLLETLVTELEQGSLDTAVNGLADNPNSLVAAFRWLHRRKSRLRHAPLLMTLIERLLVCGRAEAFESALILFRESDGSGPKLFQHDSSALKKLNRQFPLLY